MRVEEAVWRYEYHNLLSNPDDSQSLEFSDAAYMYTASEKVWNESWQRGQSSRMIMDTFDSLGRIAWDTEELRGLPRLTISVEYFLF